MYAAGLMSGTSLDGIDAVFCEITGTGARTQVKELAFETYDLPEDIKEKVQACAANTASPALLCSLNFELGKLFGQAAAAIIKKAGRTPEETAFIASHGQTVYHIPFDTRDCRASTLQLGEPAVIAEITGVPVISSFRAADMAAGGQGAPLVPYSEWVLYGQKDRNIALQNIGGIGNITLIPADCSLDEVTAFDTGPGNMMIDEAMRQLYGKEYDPGGETAASGKLIPALQEELLQHPYLKLAPPKSTGREAFGKPLVDEILKKYAGEKPEDLVHTLTWFTAFCIARSVQDWILPKMPLHELIVGGGGAHNGTLLRMLQTMLPETEVLRQEDKGYSSDAKEAIAFVILGNQTWHHLPSNVPSATGAGHPAILGSVSFPSRR